VALKHVSLEAALIFASGFAWLGTLAFVRLRDVLARLHCVAFVNIASGFALACAALIDDGISVRSTKVLAIFVALLISGAATMHAAGRAILVRGEAGR
jgi:multisubunit Na+/H+ antiporter MnhG subunit